MTKATLLFLSTLTVMAGATIAPSLPQMAEVFSDVPNAELLSKLILTIPALFIALSGPIAGRILDRYGRIKMLYFAMVLYAVAGTSGFVLDNLYLILAGRALLGVAVGGIMTTAVTLVGDYYEGKERQAFLGTQAAFMASGGVVFVSLGGLLADISWRAPFLVYLFSLLMILPVALYLYEPPKPAKAGAEGGAPPPIPRNRTLYLIYAIALVGMVLFYMLPVQIPFVLKKAGVMDNALTGMALALSIACAAFASFMYPRLRNILSTYRIYALLFLLMALGFIVIALSSSFVYILAGMMVAGLGAGMMMPNTNLWLISLTQQENRGRLMGGLTTSIFLGQFFSPVLVYPIVEVFSLPVAFWTAAVLMGGLVVGFLMKE